MVDLLYKMIYWVAEWHDRILNINNAGGWYFDDKQLHFIVIGAVGMCLIFVTYPLFKLLAETGHTMVISWLYTFTMVLGITFAIEIGQWFSGTGQPDADDMASGIAGFLIMFLVFAVIRGIFHLILGAFSGPDERERARIAEREALKKKTEESRRQQSFTGFFREKKASAKNLARGGIDMLEELTTKEEKTAEVPGLEKVPSRMDNGPSGFDAVRNVPPAQAAANDRIPGSFQEIQIPADNDSDFEVFDELENQTEDSLMNDARATLVMDVPDDRMTFVMPSPDEEVIPEQDLEIAEKRSDISEREVYKG